MIPLVRQEFSFLHQISFRGRARNRTETVQSTRDLQSRPEPRRSARPKTEEASEGLSQGGSRSLRLFQPGLCVWSLLFVGRGLRLALDTHDGPLAGEVRHTRPIAARTRMSYGALAPGRHCESECDRHGGYKEDANVPPIRSQRLALSAQTAHVVTLNSARRMKRPRR